jgi:hypothetical protein
MGIYRQRSATTPFTVFKHQSMPKYGPDTAAWMPQALIRKRLNPHPIRAARQNEAAGAADAAAWMMSAVMVLSLR